MNKLIQFELLVRSPKPPRLGNKPHHSTCSSLLLSGSFSYENSPFFCFLFLYFYVLEKSISGKPSRGIIKHCFLVHQL